MIRRPPRSTLDRSSAASDVYKRQKEAFSKSIGLGFKSPCYPNNIVVSRNTFGKPVISLKNKLESYLNETFGKCVIHVSLTDTKLYSIASVIIEQN